ncbi:MAG: cation diffusion facilitator family transporter [Anaerolineae bacterium]
MNRTLERMGVFSLLINMGLVVLKLGLAGLSGSLALAADATHSAVDIFASLAVLIGLVISKRKTKTFPFGLYKVENLVSILIALLILFAGYEIAKEALLAPATEVIAEWWMLLGVGLTVLIPFLFGRYELRVGRATNSPSLVADARHFQIDVLSSAIVFVSLGASALGLPVDRIGALLIVPIIAKSGWDLMIDGMKVLLDASLDAETLTQVRDIIESYPGVARVKSVVGRNSGRYRFLQADIEVRTTDLEKAYRVSEQLEEAIGSEVSNVERVVIHYEPRAKTSFIYGVPLEDADGKVSEHLGKAHYFARVELRAEDGALLRQEIMANPHVELEKQKGIEVAKMLVSQAVDVLLVKESLEGKGPSYVLADAGVETRITRADTLSQVLAELRGQGQSQ